MASHRFEKLEWKFDTNVKGANGANLRMGRGEHGYQYRVSGYDATGKHTICNFTSKARALRFLRIALHGAAPKTVETY